MTAQPPIQNRFCGSDPASLAARLRDLAARAPSGLCHPSYHPLTLAVDRGLRDGVVRARAVREVAAAGAPALQPPRRHRGRVTGSARQEQRQRVAQDAHPSQPEARGA